MTRTNGPTALARRMIATGADDDAILAATRRAFGKGGSPEPRLFTRTDLRRLRARIARTQHNAPRVTASRARPQSRPALPRSLRRTSSARDPDPTDVPPRTSSLAACGVYVFAGGFTLGVRRAGFQVLAQLEDGPYGVATTRANQPDVPVFTRLDAWPLAALAERKVDLMYGNPPCATFSMAGYAPKLKVAQTDKWRVDPRTSCILRQFDALRVVRPTVWAWESVQAAATRGHEMVWDLIREARDLGYAATVVLLNAADLGVPQRRRRFFLVLHRVAIPWTGRYHGGTVTVAEAWRAIADDPMEAPPVDDTTMRWLRATAPGEKLRRGFERLVRPEEYELNARGQVRGRPPFLRGRLRADRVSPTLTGGATYFHPTEDRYLTVREFQTLCGYPQDYAFSGNGPEIKYKQAAQAVMPPVGEWLALTVRDGLSRAEHIDPVTTIADLERRRVENVEDGEDLR